MVYAMVWGSASAAQMESQKIKLKQLRQMRIKFQLPTTGNAIDCQGQCTLPKGIFLTDPVTDNRFINVYLWKVFLLQHVASFRKYL